MSKRDRALENADMGAPCKKCGCTEHAACPGGCSWDEKALRRGQLICSRCVEKV